MRKSLAFIISAAIITPTLLSATPASAMCAIQVPLIGTITSVTNQGAYSKINIDHRGRYNASSLPVDRTDIDAYHTLVKAYLQNADVVPPNLKPQDSSVAPQGYSSWDDYYSQNYTYISVPTDALARASYQLGDIVLVGPPGGAACTQYGFTGFFSKEGVIRSAIATNSGRLSYKYGTESLTVTTGSDNSCVQEQFGTKCKVPITYTISGQSLIVNQGEVKQFSSTHFAQVALITSTHTTPQQGIMIEDFDPRTLLHVLTFVVPAVVTTPVTPFTSTTTPVAPSQGEVFLVSPTNGAASLQVTFSGKVSNNDQYRLDFGDKQPIVTVRCATNSSSSTLCQLPLTPHTYVLPGTYNASLTDVIACPTPAPKNQTCQAQYRTIGTAIVTVTEAQPKYAFKVVPVLDFAPISVDFVGPTDAYTYEIDFGDGSLPSQYSGPKMAAPCKPSGSMSAPGCIVASHVYGANGSYTARLSKNGTLAATISVAVPTGNSSDIDRAPVKCPIISRTLARGSRGSDVRALQQYFVAVGLLPSENVSGYFGALTQATVSQWQSNLGLEPLGIVGPRSRSLLAKCNE